MSHLHSKFNDLKFVLMTDDGKMTVDVATDKLRVLEFLACEIAKHDIAPIVKRIKERYSLQELLSEGHASDFGVQI